jgi:hypothetical protein
VERGGGREEGRKEEDDGARFRPGGERKGGGREVGGGDWRGAPYGTGLVPLPRLSLLCCAVLREGSAWPPL